MRAQKRSPSAREHLCLRGFGCGDRAFGSTVDRPVERAVFMSADPRAKPDHVPHVVLDGVSRRDHAPVCMERPQAIPRRDSGQPLPWELS